MAKMEFGEACRECIEDGICRGNCCGNVILPKRIIEKNKDKIQVSVKEVINTYNGEPMVFPITADKRCIFMNRDTFECMIYEERPDVCKEFGTNPFNIIMQCPHLRITGKRRTPAEIKVHQRKVKKQVRTTHNAMERHLGRRR